MAWIKLITQFLPAVHCAPRALAVLKNISNTWPHLALGAWNFIPTKVEWARSADGAMGSNRENA